MESDSALHAEVPDGAEVSPLEENQAGDAIEASESNVTSNEEAAAAEESGKVDKHALSMHSVVVVSDLCRTSNLIRFDTVILICICVAISANVIAVKTAFKVLVRMVCFRSSNK